MNFNRNNLDKAASPYLRQHQDNPVFWQEWNKSTLDHAKSEDKPLFLSIGYSTCHWCHVMAKEAFSDQKTADYLNRHFIAIKVDREQRPDIDKFAMDFITAAQGHGGWPLNVLLSPTGIPFFAGTYYAAETRPGMSCLLDILKRVYEYYQEHAEDIKPFQVSAGQVARAVSDEHDLVTAIRETLDEQYYGFGKSMKFPPHSTLLYLLYYNEVNHNAMVNDMITKTLDAMTRRGLHDHLQGGFFRYSTDRQWTIPHFEKMLYDQAMLLWVYSLSVKLFGRPEDKTVVNKIMSALAQSFNAGSSYFSGIDADTEHKEGATYLWDKRELRELLTAKEFKQFSQVYDLSDGLFEEKIHLVKSANVFLPRIENKLLTVRDERPQPAVDNKIITSWNALMGIGFVLAWRYAACSGALDQAVALAKTLLEQHYTDGKLIHSSTGGIKQNEVFLEDYAALTLFLSYLYEEKGVFKNELNELYKDLPRFHQDELWMMNIDTGDFYQVAAGEFDHPQPSTVSLVEYALYRTAILLGLKERGEPVKESDPFSHDFHNIVALLAKGNAYEIHAPCIIDWQKLPITAIQVKSDTYQVCHNSQCREYSSEEELLAAL